MLKNDPFVRQESRRACTQQANDIRHQLYRKGQSISGRAHTLLSKEDASRDDLLVSLGEVTAYLEIRQCVAPTVGMDQFTQSLRGTKNKLIEKLGLRTPLSHSDEDSADIEFP